LQEPESEVRHAKNIIQAAKEAGTVTAIVYSSVAMTGKHKSFPNWGPDFVMSWYWTNKAEIESLVRDAEFRSWTILRPAFLMYNYHLPFAAIMFPDLVKRHTFLTAYKPTTAMMLLDPADVGKFAAAAITDPPAYNRHEIDLGVEALTPEEIAQSLSNASGTQVDTRFYPSDEATSLALRNPLIASQLWANEVGYQVDLEALKKYPIKLTTFAEYLEREKVAVLRTFSKNKVC
jgi:nucleoside-diphosphate-sugar epimerase